jgi:hypothetical protein
MTDSKCDTRSHGNFLYGKKQSAFTVLYRLYNYCYASLMIHSMELHDPMQTILLSSFIKEFGMLDQLYGEIV